MVESLLTSPQPLFLFSHSDAAAMQAKKAAKDAQKAALLASGEDGAAQVAAEEKRKAEQRARQKDSKFTSNNPLLAKQLKKK